MIIIKKHYKFIAYRFPFNIERKIENLNLDNNKSKVNINRFLSENIENKLDQSNSSRLKPKKHEYKVTVYIQIPYPKNEKDTTMLDKDYMSIDFSLLDRIIKPCIDKYNGALLINKILDKDLYEYCKSSRKFIKVIGLERSPTLEILAFEISSEIYWSIKEYIGKDHYSEVTVEIERDSTISVKYTY